MSTSNEPSPLSEPSAPAARPVRSAGKGTLFDNVFLNSGGVRSGWRAGVFVSLVLALVGAGQLLTSGLGLFSPVNARDLTPWPLFFQEAILFIAALAGSAALGLIEDRNVGDYGLPWRSAFRRYFRHGAAWGFGEISVLVVLISGVGGYALGSLIDNGGIPGILLSAISWLAVFVMVGLAEEFVFRGYLLKTLSEGMGFWPASLVLSIAFGAVHYGNPGENPIGLATVVLVGLFFCLTVRRTGNLWFAVGAHAAHDFGQAYFYSVPNSGTLIHDRLFSAKLTGPAWLTGGAAGPEGSLLEIGVLVVVMVLFDGLYRGKE
jgi:membrane protease YdiL (CAAX protease family)